MLEAQGSLCHICETSPPMHAIFERRALRTLWGMFVLGPAAAVEFHKSTRKSISFLIHRSTRRRPALAAVIISASILRCFDDACKAVIITAMLLYVLALLSCVHLHTIRSSIQSVWKLNLFATRVETQRLQVHISSLLFS